MLIRSSRHDDGGAHAVHGIGVASDVSTPALKALVCHVLERCPDATVVISSVQRVTDKNTVGSILRSHGYGYIVGRLHEDWLSCEPWVGGSRAAEIVDWVSRYPEITRVAAIDSDPSVAMLPWGLLVEPKDEVFQDDEEAAIRLLSA